MAVIQDPYDRRTSVKYYGAKGDDATDDTQAIEDAIVECLAKPNGGTIYFPVGIFRVQGVTASAAFQHANGSKIRFEGQGMFNSTIKFTEDNADSAIFAFTDWDEIEFANLGFDGGVTARPFENPESGRVAWNRALDIRGCRKVSFEKIHTRYTGNSALRVAWKGLPGSDATPHGTEPSDTFTMTGCVIEDAYGSGGILTKSGGTNNLIIAGNHFRRCGIQAISLESEDPVDGVEDVVTGRHVVSNNVIDTTDAEYAGNSTVGYGITLQENVAEQIVADNVFRNIGGVAAIDLTSSAVQSDTPVKQTVITGNNIDTVTQGSRLSAVALRSGESDISNVLIANNRASNVMYGVDLRPNTQGTTGGTVRDIKISGNHFDVAQVGVWYNTDDGVDPVENIQVTDNKILAGRLSVQLYVDGAHISGNYCRGKGDVDVNGNQLYTHSVGIRAGSANVTVIDNDVEDSPIISTRMNGLFSVFQLGEHYLWVDSSGALRISDALVRPTLATRDTHGAPV